ncbi:MAG: DinB family protein [Chloroflexi bacterium]|nr:DinB family protein [Chloroflexota bacterium]
MNKEQALAGLEKSRQALNQTIEGLSEGEMTQIQVEGVWTIKDLVGHITSWEEIVLQPLRRYADGDLFETNVLKDYLAWNDEQVALKQDIPLDAILKEATAVRDELVATANRLSTE